MKVPWTEREWRRVVVYGLGSSGRAATRLLGARGVRVVAVDRRSADEIELGGLRTSPTVELLLGGEPSSLPAGVDGVVLSPGVPGDRPLVQEAEARGLVVVAEVELASLFLNGPLIGITGSNGKSTTTSLTGALLAAAGFGVEVCGNIGRPMSACIDGPAGRVFVAELSSFQLEAVRTLHPRVAALLNVSADHLDRHGSEAAYLEAKAAIFARQGPEDIAVLNADDPLVRDLAVRARRRLFSRLEVVEDGCYLADGTVLEARPGHDPRPLFSCEDLRLNGIHNLENAMAASLAASSLGADPAVLAPALARFEGLPHRMQTVAVIGGVAWIDDSKGTNVGAVLKSLAGMRPHSVHLILGGRSKRTDFAPLAAAVRQSAARVYLIGETATEIGAALGPEVVAETCGDLERAVAAAATRARRGETVLLSPACASFDQYTDYAARGEHFRQLVHELEGAGDG